MGRSPQSVLVAGETLVDFIPESSGPLADVESFVRRAGGSTANVAVALARLDRAPMFWTRVGADPFGEFLVTTLASNGVPTDLVERDPDARTALAFVSHDAEGDREFVLYRDGSADTRLEPGAVDDTLDDVGWVHVGGVTLADEPARTATYDLAARAADAGCTVSFDPNARPQLWEEFDYAGSVERMFGLVDVVSASREDLAAAGMTRNDPGALARAVRDRGPDTVFVTLGADGAVGVAGESAPWGPGAARHPGYAVDAVDTTGAGDAFTAGVIAALTGGNAVAETVAFANGVAAVTTTGRGAMAALPDRDSVRALRQS